MAVQVQKRQQIRKGNTVDLHRGANRTFKFTQRLRSMLSLVPHYSSTVQLRSANSPPGLTSTGFTVGHFGFAASPSADSHVPLKLVPVEGIIVDMTDDNSCVACESNPV